MIETIVVPTERAGLELDEFLCLQFPSCSKGFLRRQVRDGAILVDGIQAHPSQRLRTNQVLIVEMVEEDPLKRFRCSTRTRTCWCSRSPPDSR